MTTSPMTSCRHCKPTPFTKSYASVALLGNECLESAVEALEGRGIVPCVNAVCGKCGELSVIVYEDCEAPYVHALAMWERVGKYLL